ncbi:LytR C-terminal domain-containing protein [Massilia sp. YIM B02769]|uniref:LytR C-terminal domain-containing protein n=1 Tax=Massilia sp. YIM B02769 TaxID=3050129 RepID=UPI0025B6CC43|nr:LytR C-terminal domain-containing protein [Massilia sp. YIM B02769]MDN4057041.1 LytR C-terminal domain-containing protein [Massilia sp. YIM B02769]
MKPRSIIKNLSVVCAGALLLACADLARQPETQAGPDAEYAYGQGRAHHLAGRYPEAVQAYRAVLAADPRHVRARNALAAAYARQGDFAQAIPIWRALTAELKPDSGPGGAYLFANLGYAYLLGGDHAQAVTALEKACLLDPLNGRAWHNLGETLRRMGQHERAELMFRQASALQQHDFRSDYTAAGGSAVAAIQAAVEAPRPDPEWAATQVLAAADGTLTLRRIPSLRALAQELPAGLPPQPLPSRPRKRPEAVLLEIRNGNGVTGMARALSRQVGGDLLVTRLSNEPGFKVQRTRIEHGAAYRDVAALLAGRMTGQFGGVALVQVDSTRPVDVRLVIGQDMARGKLVLRPAAPADARPLAIAALAKAP